ncbi:MAG: CDP-glycerol glycerophosphotransferase family protein [Lentihominibacter sp.]|jgi:CDP-glycerol glycerophosphotransferase (TagB/SpsB family)
MGFKHSALKLGIACLRGIYALMKLQNKQNRISIISRQSEDTSLDIRMLSNMIREKYPEVECHVLVKFIKPGIGSKLGYAFHLLSQMNAMAKSRVVVLDGYCIAASVLNHKEGTIIIQMWHSMAAIKKFGRQTVDKSAGHSSEIADIMCMHRNYDYVISPSQKTGQFFCQGFDISRDKLVEMCLPRIDYIKQRKEQDENNIIEKDSETHKEIILYAPTFRKNDELKVRELFQAIDYDRFLLVVKPHPLYAESFSDIIGELNLEGKVIVDSEDGTFDWLGRCDRVITDYSAVAVESLVTEKPLYFYVYDIDEYEEKVGLNVNPVVEMPSISARTGDELRALLGSEYDIEMLKNFRNRYLTADTEKCTEKLADFIVGVVDWS